MIKIILGILFIVALLGVLVTNIIKHRRRKESKLELSDRQKFLIDSALKRAFSCREGKVFKR